ncbi:type II toxin-antitoxin system RelE/ParE family toxin [Ideonella sp. 4Y11]|uniref:Type II toxin-antitoxin system RelE/ParE family toxin n=1 Tax=Ideonella aquatica TaxID=2824119 RepID=A0A940YST3_9BURK|nr:type II toxin-antitoxin system RelE/ParE family toxin [Ideonella aquatica]MBQ0961801.1 type II toxin-antitoxin system RelE/ParE family toxin [Ideonella aquatica]
MLTTVFQTRWFARWARRQGIGADSLCRAIEEIRQGLVDADLGGGLIKKRLSRPGTGKRGAYRTLLATRRGERWIFVFGFAKNDQDNLEPHEIDALKALAAHLLALSPEALRQATQAGELMEVNCDAQATLPRPLCRS